MGGRARITNAKKKKVGLEMWTEEKGSNNQIASKELESKHRKKLSGLQLTGLTDSSRAGDGQRGK